MRKVLFIGVVVLFFSFKADAGGDKASDCSNLFGLTIGMSQQTLLQHFPRLELQQDTTINEAKSGTLLVSVEKDKGSEPPLNVEITVLVARARVIQLSALLPSSFSAAITSCGVHVSEKELPTKPPSTITCRRINSSRELKIQRSELGAFVTLSDTRYSTQGLDASTTRLVNRPPCR
jgi:hypothetical protein